MLAAEGSFVKLKDKVEGGAVGGKAKGGFVELGDGVEGGDVGGGAEGDFVELGDGVEGGDVGGGTQQGFGIESLERVRVSDWERVRVGKVKT